jgi:hypothetical protein
MGSYDKPQVREFDNLRTKQIGIQMKEKISISIRLITTKREPLTDGNSTYKEVKNILAIGGVKKEDIIIFV